MFKADALEAEPLVLAALDALLQWAPGRGREGADLRAHVGIIRVNAAQWLHDDRIGEPLSECFDLAFELGIPLSRIENVAVALDPIEPVTAGAIVIKNSIIQLVLVTAGRIIANMDFRSRQDVEAVQELMNKRFGDIAEQVADRLDAMTYRAIIALHAAITFFLIETARPRPRMINFRFNVGAMSTLTMAYRLYGDASRADELRYENRVIHPAFALPFGQALSA